MTLKDGFFNLRPDNITWCWPSRAFLFGWDYQKYGFGACCFSIFFGPVVFSLA